MRANRTGSQGKLSLVYWLNGTRRVERLERKLTDGRIWSKESPLQKTMKIRFLLERLEFLWMSWTSLLCTHKKKHNVTLEIFVKFGWWWDWSHCMCTSLRHLFWFITMHACCLNNLNQVYIACVTSKPLVHCFYKVIMKQPVGHVYVFIILAFLKT